MPCGRCRSSGRLSLEYALTENPPHLEARCRTCDDHVKFVDRGGRDKREGHFQPSDLVKQQIRERDRSCRFCNFDVTAKLQAAIADPRSVPALSDVTEKMIQRAIAEKRRALQEARMPSFFDVSDFAARPESELAAIFFDLTDAYAEAAFRDGQRMMHFDHLLPVKYIRPIANSFSDAELRILGQDCVVLSCNVCNNIRRERLEDEARLLELYLRIFLSGYRSIPETERRKFDLFARAVAEVHRRLNLQEGAEAG